MGLLSSLLGTISYLISPIISILTGLLFTKAGDIFHVMKSKDLSKQDEFRIEGIVKTANLIGILTMIYGAIRLLRRLIDLPNDIMRLF